VNRRLENHELASAELEAAVRWYEEKRSNLGAEFLDAVTDTVAIVARQPELGTVMEGTSSTRRILVHRFPYQVVYHVTSSQITIVAIAHLKRRPNFWKSRLQP
jgi:plasmid stabilization system protein ParE